MRKRLANVTSLACCLLFLVHATRRRLQNSNSDPGPIQLEQMRSLRPTEHRRHLQAVDKDLQKQQMSSFFGGLYPAVDQNMFPLYLRDLDKTKTEDLVFFWHIPKAAGSTMKNIMNACFDLKRAEKVRPETSMEYGRPGVLNMDTSTPGGLQQSFKEGIVDSGMVDVVISNYFLGGSALFNERHYGRAFTIMRHPIELAVSLFHYRKIASWERSFREDFEKMTITDYIASDGYIGNWMTRQLTGTMPWVELTEQHLERAKAIMQKKIFVGIQVSTSVNRILSATISNTQNQDQMAETIRQMRSHFGWKENAPFCAHNLLNDKINSNEHPSIPGGRGGLTWNIVAEKDKWDLQLYHMALYQFADQRKRYPPPEGAD